MEESEKKGQLVMHRAIVVGCGRIGVGYGDWPKTSHPYTHADTYQAWTFTRSDKDRRVKLVGLVDPIDERRQYAGKKYGLRTYSRIYDAMEESPDIASVCVQPEQQEQALKELLVLPSIRGVWCEKPFVCDDNWPWPIQVNYIRRFDDQHTTVNVRGFASSLFVVGKRDIHTVCHFVDLARWWKIPLDQLHYFHYDGPCSYFVRTARERDNVLVEDHFPLGGMAQGFMENALMDLMNHMDHHTPLTCPASEAVLTWKATQELEAMWKAQA